MRSLSLGKPLDSTLWEYTRPYRSIVPNKLSLASSLARSLVSSRARALSLRSLFYSLARSLSGAVSPDRALYLPTSSHFVIVNKTSLSPPPPRPPSISLSPDSPTPQPTHPAVTASQRVI